MSRTKDAVIAAMNAETEMVASLDLAAQDGRACTLCRTPFDVAEPVRADILKIPRGASVRARIVGKTVVGIEKLPSARDPPKSPTLANESQHNALKVDVVMTPINTPVASCGSPTYTSPLAEVAALDEQISEVKKVLKDAEARRKALCEAAADAGFMSDGRYQLQVKTTRTRHVEPVTFAMRYPEAFPHCVTVSITKAKDLIGDAALNDIATFTESVRFDVVEIPTDPGLKALALQKGWIEA